MSITPEQIKILQSICSGKFQDREERLEFISDFFGIEVRSIKELTKPEADELIYYFNTGKMPDNASYAVFDKYNTKHKRILGVCHTLGWVCEDNPGLVDLHRLGSWIRSRKCPVKGKSLREMTSAELSKVIHALDNISIKQFS